MIYFQMTCDRSPPRRRGIAISNPTADSAHDQPRSKIRLQHERREALLPIRITQRLDAPVAQFDNRGGHAARHRGRVERRTASEGHRNPTAPTACS